MGERRIPWAWCPVCRTSRPVSKAGRFYQHNKPNRHRVPCPVSRTYVEPEMIQTGGLRP